MYMKYEPSIKPTEVIRSNGGNQWVKWDEMRQHHKERQDLIASVKSQSGKSSGLLIDSNFETFEAKDATVWIDPLDGTKYFIKGNLHFVTVVIGISIKNESRIGIVHYPFFDVNNDKKVFQQTTFFGTVEHGMYRLDLSEHQRDNPVEYKLRQALYVPPKEPLKAHDVKASFIIGHTANDSQVVESMS